MVEKSAPYFARREVAWYAIAAAATVALDRSLIKNLGAELVVLLSLAGIAHLIYQRQQSAARPNRRVSTTRADNGQSLLTLGGAAFFILAAGILQAAPKWMPEAGAAVALLAVAPVFFAFARDRHVGLLATLGATALLSTISLPATSTFVLTTVPLGAGLAWAFGAEVNAREALYQVAGALFVGMLCLTYLAGTPALFGWAEAQGTWQELLIYACTAFLYTLAWATALAQITPEPQAPGSHGNLRRIA